MVATSLDRSIVWVCSGTRDSARSHDINSPGTNYLAIILLLSRLDVFGATPTGAGMMQSDMD